MIEAILNYDFMRYSFISGIIVGLIAPLLGTFIVVRRLSLIADALSHVALGGIAFGVYLTSIFNIVINPVVSGVVFSVIGALGIEKLRGLYKHYSEIAIPIIMSLGIALSVLFLSLANGFNQDLFGYLFGSISAVSFSDLILISIIGVIVVLFVFFLYKEMFFISFDEEYAGVMKLSKYIHIIFIILVALVISASMRIVGILLVSAMMTLPVASAMRITSSFKQLMFVSILFGEAAVIAGLFLGFHLDISPGGTIVLVSIAILLCTLVLNRVGVVKNAQRTR
ncbi:High-affinity zinc uptake system membrane protein ZnuB [Jeotgalicoccus aerolatus]|uniref:Zinc transport system permease protein n=1 Tax=Jeotgalicoccus aerolatus TaxID=709510 RepID=A0A1G8UP10_9STAP|nr:metal ABC transporter permease [Jeotgalicoccus aerolatus]MBP1951704.1 zinc transport system permease protein [Jeotgalicoccus aerolatus]NMA80470.1 metal ABC transporter permease [Jeotgalicoccus aerolatus]CAD2075521.1 High-affinity zinc uptake system membrane protein ZnuB [Jeotgalicoccus aerolatus]SDJ55384.1 zinc transport system permease protein [Jeotgalicoccus aerolatus]GGD95467.1 iron ABC transporter permease [Jeotgalicoccus aerolatus]